MWIPGVCGRPPPAGSSWAVTRMGGSPASGWRMSRTDQRMLPNDGRHQNAATPSESVLTSAVSDAPGRSSGVAASSFADATTPSPVILLAAEATTGTPATGPHAVEHRDPNRPRHHVARGSDLLPVPAEVDRSRAVRTSWVSASCTVRVRAKPLARRVPPHLARDAEPAGRDDRDVERLIVIVEPARSSASASSGPSESSSQRELRDAVRSRAGRGARPGRRAPAARTRQVIRRGSPIAAKPCARRPGPLAACARPPAPAPGGDRRASPPGRRRPTRSIVTRPVSGGNSCRQSDSSDHRPAVPDEDRQRRVRGAAARRAAVAGPPRPPGGHSIVPLLLVEAVREPDGARRAPASSRRCAAWPPAGNRTAIPLSRAVAAGVIGSGPPSHRRTIGTAPSSFAGPRRSRRVEPGHGHLLTGGRAGGGQQPGEAVQLPIGARRPRAGGPRGSIAPRPARCGPP